MTAKLWAVMPAAGIGARMQADLPKQYMTVRHQTIIEISAKKILSIPGLNQLVIATARDDSYFPQTSLLTDKKVYVCEGGEQRADSVYRGLVALKSHYQAKGGDWVIVHDAVRPCFSIEQALALVEKARAARCGAILASQVSDTLKRVDCDTIEKTVDREQLWQAHTPQCFPFQLLYDALSMGLTKGWHITDEASAVEHYIADAHAEVAKTLVVPDRRDNIKITLPEDLELARLILDSQRVFG